MAESLNQKFRRLKIGESPTDKTYREIEQSLEGKKLTLSESTRLEISKIIGNEEKANSFIHIAEHLIHLDRVSTAMGKITASKRLARRRNILKLHSACKMFRQAMENIDELGKYNFWRVSIINLGMEQESTTFEKNLEKTKMDVALFEEITKIMTSYRRKRGRRIDGHNFYIQGLAHYFKMTGKKVSTGDRSHFVQVVKLIFKDSNIHIADVRQKIKAALSRTTADY